MAPKLTRDSELIRTARAVLQLQRRIAKARRQIKAWQGDLKHERQMLRGLAYAAENRPDVAPSRLTGGTTGYVRPALDTYCPHCGAGPADAAGALSHYAHCQDA